LYLGKSAGLSFQELNELTFSDLLSYVGFLTEEKNEVKDATQKDIDLLAV
jgi:hypothetical protein